MKKIMQFIHGMTFGGAEKIVFEYCMLLDKSKFDVYLLCFEHGDIDKEKSLRDAGIHVIVISDYMSSRIDSIRFIGRFKRYLTVRKIIRDLNPDIIHTHMAINSYVLFSHPHKKTHIVHTVHSDIERQWDGNINNRVDLYSVKFLAKKYKMDILALHTKMREEINKREIKANIHVIPNGVILEQYRCVIDKKAKRRELNIPPDAVVIGAVGRLSAIKNYAFLIDIFIEYTKQRHNTFLLIVGDGPERDKIEKKLRYNHIMNYMIISGRDDVPQLMALMDVILLTSFSESFSLVTVEAQLVGTRCIVSDVVPRDTMISNLVTYKKLDDGVNGWVEEIKKSDISEIQYYDMSHIDMGRIINNLEKVYLQE